MKTFYCQVGRGSTFRNGRFEILMHVSSLETIGVEKHEAQTVEDFQTLITEHGVDKVMFYFWGFPARAVVAAKTPPLFRKLIRLYGGKDSQ